MVIDFHTHVFPDHIAEQTLHVLSGRSGTRPATDGTAQGLSGSMKEAGIDLSVNLPVLTHPKQADKVNDSLLRNYEEMLHLGILTFAGMHPDYENYRDKLRLLSREGIKGIKLHPAYQGTDLDAPSMMRIIDAASEYGLVILVHAGLDIGIPGHDYSSVKMILHILDEIRPGKLVLAHMGGWKGWAEVERDLAGADVWFDTAFSIGPIDTVDNRSPAPCNMEDEPFLSLCRKHGTDRILFATDCPWSDQKTYLETIRRLPLTEEERAAILGGNAEKLLGL